MKPVGLSGLTGQKMIHHCIMQTDTHAFLALSINPLRELGIVGTLLIARYKGRYRIGNSFPPVPTLSRKQKRAKKGAGGRKASGKTYCKNIYSLA